MIIIPKYLDLFAGAGGLSEGFIRAGYEPVAHVEMDAAACYTLRTRTAYHWLKKENNLVPYTKYLAGDISRKDFYDLIPKEILGSVLNYEISEESLPGIFKDIDALLDGEKLDLIVGGPPCQAYSIAGRSRSENKMIGDKRNYLYRLYAEFLKNISQNISYLKMFWACCPPKMRMAPCTLTICVHYSRNADIQRTFVY